MLILRENGEHKTFSFPTKKRFKNSGYCGYIVVSQWFLVVSREYVSRSKVCVSGLTWPIIVKNAGKSIMTS